MRTIAVTGAGVLAQLIALSGQNPPTSFRTRTDVVTVPVAVTQSSGSIPKLAREDFSVNDNNVAQQIIDLEIGSLPVDVRLVVDTTGTVTNAERTFVERAVNQLSAVLRPSDRLGVVTFATSVERNVALQAPPINVVLPTRSRGIGAAVLDALLLAMVTPQDADRLQMVLLVTDGDDNASYFDKDTLLTTSEHTSSVVYVVLVASRATAQVRGTLDTVAHTTGGGVIQLRRTDDLPRAIVSTIEAFRMSYILRYSPTGVSRSGWHEISVRVKQQNLRVRARRGYWSRG